MFIKQFTRIVLAGVVILGVFSGPRVQAVGTLEQSIPVGPDVTSTLKQKPVTWEEIVTPQLQRAQVQEQQRTELQRAEEERIEAERIAAEAAYQEQSRVIETPVVTLSYGNGYDYGQCTYYVARRKAVPGNWGSAGSWLSNARAAGYATGSVPQPGVVAWSPGHVAYVESVSGGNVTVSEMNFWGNGGGWNIVSYRTVPAGSFTYIY